MALTPTALAADNPEPQLPEVDEAHFYRVAFTVGDHPDQKTSSAPACSKMGHPS